MGRGHAETIPVLDRCTLTAVCDLRDDRLDRVQGAVKFHSSSEMIASGLIDAVVVATPHYGHTTIGIEALSAGLHLLVEKPISVHKADCERLIGARQSDRQVFAAMFNQRTDPHYQKIREIVSTGQIGAIQRVNWIVTNWFRTEIYYASGDWRATWGGEGGGVLLNQCPHNLDLLQWMFGMPSRVTAFCGFGKHHDIEVEDDVTAYFEYPNGATGVFVTTTGEAPGTNRLEVAGDCGKLVFDQGEIVLTKTADSVKSISRTSLEAFASVPTTSETFSISEYGGQHREVLENFIDAILDGAPLIAPAEDGIHSVEIANAMLMSTFEGRTIELPLDAAAYEALLKARIAGSRFEKRVVENVQIDMSKSVV